MGRFFLEELLVPFKEEAYVRIAALWVLCWGFASTPPGPKVQSRLQSPDSRSDWALSGSYLNV